MEIGHLAEHISKVQLNRRHSKLFSDVWVRQNDKEKFIFRRVERGNAVSKGGVLKHGRG